MRVAVLADVHANLAALEAVANAVRNDGVDATLILGDLVGYNAEPREVIDLLREMATHVVLGNHDKDATSRAPTAGTHVAARTVQEWTASVLREDQMRYLAALPAILTEPREFVAVHGCYLNDRHYTGYVTETMLEANLRVIQARPDLPALAFCGHTHVPLAGILVEDQVIEMPRVTEMTYPAKAAAVLINPGAVGQPRTGDPRACYAIVDTARRGVNFRRVEYDVGRTIDAIQRAGLPEALALRLQRGE